MEPKRRFLSSTEYRNGYFTFGVLYMCYVVLCGFRVFLHLRFYRKCVNIHATGIIIEIKLARERMMTLYFYI